MKKFLIFCMVALVAMCGLNSCSEDCDHNFIEVDYNKKLAGTWTTIDAENEFAEALIFNADGTVTSTGVFEGAFFEKKIAEFAIILELNGYSGCMEIG